MNTKYDDIIIGFGKGGNLYEIFFRKMSKVFCLIIANEIVLNETVFLTSLQGNSFLLKLKNKFKNKFVRVCLIRKETL